MKASIKKNIDSLLKLMVSNKCNKLELKLEDMDIKLELTSDAFNVPVVLPTTPKKKNIDDEEEIINKEIVQINDAWSEAKVKLSLKG